MPEETATATAEPTEAPEDSAAESAPEPVDRKSAVMEKLGPDAEADIQSIGEGAEVDTQPTKPEAKEPKPEAEPESGESRVFFNEKAGRWQKDGNFISRDKARELGVDVDSVETETKATVEPEAEAEAEETPETDEGEPKFETVKGIDNRGNEVEVKIPTEGLDQKQVETLRMWANDSERARTMMTEAKAKADEVAEFEAMLQDDPIGVVTGYIPDEQRIEVARALLSDEKVFSTIQDELEDWGYNPEKRQRTAAEIDRDRYKRELERERRSQNQRQAKQTLQAIENKVTEVVDDDLQVAALDIVENHIRRTKQFPSPDEIPDLLRDRGIRVNAAGSSKRNTRPTSPDEPPASDDAAEESAQVKGSSSPNRAALATTPAGGTTPATKGLNVPKDIKLRDRSGEGKSAKDFILGRFRGA